MDIGREIISKTSPGGPAFSTDPNELYERAIFNNRIDLLLKDPMNLAIINVIRHSIEQVGGSIVKNKDGDSKSDSKQYVWIGQILKFFPAAEYEEVASRLEILLGANILKYFRDVEKFSYGIPRMVSNYPLRPWSVEMSDHSAKGYRFSDELINYLKLQEERSIQTSGTSDTRG